MMKSTQKITRLQLKAIPNEDYSLIGIVSSDPDYKLSLSINKKFGISLKNITPLKISEDVSSELSFSRFSDSGRSPELVFNLFSNRSGKIYLLKNLKNIDYILQVQDYENEYDINKLISGLREIESVNAVFSIDKKIIREKHLQHLTL